jgi:hypothetical protein
MAQCKRDGCTNEADDRYDGYCGMTCYFDSGETDDDKKDGGLGGVGGPSIQP